MFYAINSSPMLVTKSGFKLIFVLSTYQTCNIPLKALDNIGNYSKGEHNNLLGNQQWRAVDSIQHCEKRLPLKYRSFWRKTYFLTQLILKDFRPEAFY